MKVGVLLSAHDPRTGGGHTFEAALLDGLLRCAAQSDHTFVVLVKGKTRFQDAPNVRFEHLTEGRKMRAKLLAGVSAVTRWRPGSTTVFSRKTGTQILTFSVNGAGTITDAETGTTWDKFGNASEGELAGTQLEALVHGQEFWFAIATFRPDTEVRLKELLAGE